MMMSAMRRAAVACRRPIMARQPMIRPAMPVLAMRQFSAHEERNHILDDYHEYFDHFQPDMFEWTIMGH